MKNPKRRHSPCFVAYINFCPSIQLGFHIDILSPNVEFFLPFCHIKIGREWIEVYSLEQLTNNDNCFGIKRKLDTLKKPDNTFTAPRYDDLYYECMDILDREDTY